MTSVAPKPSTSDELIEQLMQLPKEQRLRIADRILKSVEDEAGLVDVPVAWKAEITRRIRSLQDGTAVLLDGQEHLRRLRDKYGA